MSTSPVVIISPMALLDFAGMTTGLMTGTAVVGVIGMAMLLTAGVTGMQGMTGVTGSRRGVQGVGRATTMMTEAAVAGSMAAAIAAGAAAGAGAVIGGGSCISCAQLKPSD